MNIRGAIYIISFCLIGILLSFFVKTYFEEDAVIRILSTTVNENCPEQLKDNDFTSQIYEVCEGESLCSYPIQVDKTLAKCKPLVNVEWVCQDSGFVRVIYSSTETKDPNHENFKIELRCPGRMFRPSHSIAGI
jgi:hypothetical protein